MPVAPRPVHLQPHLGLFGPERQDAAGLAATRAAEQVRGEVVTEHVQRGEHEAGDTVRVGAGPTAADNRGGPARRVEGVHAPGAVRQRGHRAGQAGQAELARAALPGRLLGQVAHDPGHLAERAGAAERHHDAGPQHAARRVQSGPGDRHVVGELGGQPHPVVAADQHAVVRGRLADIQYRAERDAGGHFHHGGAAGGAADGQQDGARLVRGAVGGVAFLPQHGEDGQLGERLGVGQQRGQPVHSALRGPALLARRQCDLAVHGVDQGAPLTRYEPVGHLDHADDLLEVRFSPGRLGHRGRHGAVRHPDDDHLGGQGPRGQQRTTQHQVGRTEQQHLVLGAARLALGAVDQDHRFALAGGRVVDHRTHLAGERERGPATAPQVDAFHHFDQLARGHTAHGPKDLLMRREINALKAIQAGG